LDVVVFTSIHMCWSGLGWNLVQVPLQSTPTHVDWCESDYIQTRPKRKEIYKSIFHNESINFNLALLVYTKFYILTVKVKEKFDLGEVYMDSYLQSEKGTKIGCFFFLVSVPGKKILTSFSVAISIWKPPLSQGKTI